MDTILETTGLTKRFGDQCAVDGLSLEVPRGSIYGFLGANGAGKTTTLRLVLGLLRPDKGEIRLFGERSGQAVSRHRIGALIETPSLYPHLTGAENLDLTRRLLGLSRSEIGRTLDLVDLADAASKIVSGYSLGMKQRLAIARALLGSPELLILDEPINGLDPEGIADMRGLLRRLAEETGTTLIISTHMLPEIELIATHVAIMHRGRMLVQDRLDNLLGGSSLLEIETDNPEQAAKVLCGAGFAARTDGRFVLVDGQDEAGQVAALLVHSGQTLRHLAQRRPSLEGIYHRNLAIAA
ncbi:MAG: ATP-binding cassette domain-containing protein [Sphingomicrobium sp.]